MVAVAVTAEAAVHYLITSPAHIKPGTLTLRDFSKTLVTRCAVRQARAA
jgi:hypothetical protein